LLRRRRPVLEGHAGGAAGAGVLGCPGCWSQDSGATRSSPPAGRGRAGRSNDVVWAVVQFAAVGVLLATGRNSSSS
jgi:hypothetical protein